MGDVYAGHAEGLQRAQYFHELVDLGLGEGRGGLVEDEYVGLFGKGLGYFCHLHLPYAEGLHDFVRRDGKLIALQELVGVGVELVPVDRGAVPRLLAEVDILADGHEGYERELLIDDRDTFFDGLVDGA